MHSRRDRRHYRPRFSRTLTIARRGSTKTLGLPEVRLACLVLAEQIVCHHGLFRSVLRAFSTSRINSIRRCPSEMSSTGAHQEGSARTAAANPGLQQNPLLTALWRGSGIRRWRPTAFR